MGATRDGKTRINQSLITLKLVTFFIISGLAAIHILNARQPQIWGLNFDEFRIINIIIPVITLIGPLIVGPLADKLAAKNPVTFGKNLRFITAILLVLATIFYGCLLAIPTVHREEARRPRVSFSCNSSGAEIFQERCTEDAQCHHWSREKIGSLILTNCSYTCQNPNKFENLYSPWMKGSPIPPTETSSDSEYQDENDYEDHSVTESFRPRRQLITEDSREVFSAEHVPDKVFVEPPHLCTKRYINETHYVIVNCHVYTMDTVNLKVQATLRSATNADDDNTTHSKDWCNYPLDGYQCNVPAVQAKWMAAVTNTSNCKAAVECDVYDPYDSPGSVLANSQCIKTTGDVDTTFWGYLIVRGFGEIFLLAVLTLLNTAIIIAVRDTSEGRGEVCRQYVWGAIGYVIILPLINFAHGQFKEDHGVVIITVVIAIICFLLAAIILILANKMPLSPPEWWWHTKTGMLVYPMSAIRRYGPEMLVLTVISLVFGIFWSSIHTYLHWTYLDYDSATISGILFVLLLFFNADKFIEYCGHSNILIGGFAIFIIRFTALAENIDWLTVTMEIIEPLAIGLIWITIILYMRHIMPRKFTATGQAIAVIAFFCLGKCFGALIGLARDEKKPDKDNCMYHGLAIAACVIAIVYFIMYNILLAPRCAARPQPPNQLNLSQPASNGAGGTANSGNSGGGTGVGATNGNYTPLRVYHNERGKKNQFRY